MWIGFWGKNLRVVSGREGGCLELFLGKEGSIMSKGRGDGEIE